MKEKVIRKEVYLTEEVVRELQKQAELEGRLLKNYMEQILIKQAKKGK